MSIKNYESVFKLSTIIIVNRWLPVPQYSRRNYEKISTFYEIINFPQKWAWPCHTPQGSQKHFLPFWISFQGSNTTRRRRNFEKYLLLAYKITKLLTFSQKWAWPCHALLGDSTCSYKFVLSISDHKLFSWKNNQFKLPFNKQLQFLQKMGVSLPRPSQWRTCLKKSWTF